MRLLQPHQMALSTATICDLCDLFPEFSMLHLLVRVAGFAISSQALSVACQLSHGCTCDRLKRHFPNCVRPRDYVELHGQLMLLVLNSKHNVHHREQRLHGVTVELNDDMEYEQIY
jgi:hypothetical protein